MNDRIKLAEAMGWKWDESPNQFAPGMGRWWFKGMCKDWGTKEQLSSYFDPFTDANDDYAVLKFARMAWKPAHTMESHHKWPTFVANLRTPDRYQIGDYARAALAVIETTDE